MTTISVSVPDISCDHCKSSIEGAVSLLEGVNRVEVHIEPRTVDLEFDEDTVGFDAIVQTIEDQGYDVARG